MAAETMENSLAQTFAETIEWLTTSLAHGWPLAVPATEDTTVGALLAEGRVQKWRHATYCAHRAAYVRKTSDGSIVRDVSPSLAVARGDRLFIEELPPAGQAALQAIADAEAEDYAFVEPEDDDYLRNAAAFFHNRPRTTVIDELQTLRDFVGVLRGKTAGVHAREVDKPIRSLLIASHAQAHGYMDTGVAGDADPLDYERVRELAGQGANSVLALESWFVEPRPRSGSRALPFAVEVVGCNVGNAIPFLRDLRAAMNADELRAPRHLTVALPELTCLRRVITVRTPAPFGHRADVVRAFETVLGPAEKHLAEIVVPSEQWNVDNKVATIPAPEFDLVVQGRTFSPCASYRYRTRAVLKRRQVIDPDPGSDAQRKQFVLQHVIPLDPQYSAAFPAYLQFGEASEQDFADHLDWRFGYEGGKLTCHPVQHAYHLGIPYFLTASGTKQRFYRYCPAAGGTAEDTMPTDDPRYFGKVTR